MGIRTPGFCLAVFVAATGLGIVLLFSPARKLVALTQAGDLDRNLPQPIQQTASPSSHQPGGQVLDRDALAQVRTFCVDTSRLERSDEESVKEFLARQGQPKKLLARLPWKLIGDCTAADAVARVYFAPANLDMQEEGLLSSQSNSRQVFQPVLVIYDKASIRLFYRAEGQVLRGKREDLLASPFSMLLKDVKAVDR